MVDTETMHHAFVDRSRFVALMLRQFAVAGLLLAVSSGVSLADTLHDCEQDDVASTALRACTMLLGNGGLDPKERGRIYTLRGVAWMTEDDPSAAAEDFSHAIELEDTNVRAIRGRARAHSQIGSYGLAAADWGRLIAMKPENEEYYRNRGAAHLADRKTDLAFADYAKALEIDPKSAEAHIGRALIYDYLGDRAAALDEFTAALEINPGYIPAHWAKAQAAERWGDKALAIQSYSTLLKYNGVYAHARKALDRLGIHTPP